MFKILKQKGAISLAEILVVIVIIGILATVILINYPAVKKQLALQRAATKLAQDIRRAQEMAVASEGCCGSPPIVPETGYGIYINIGGGGNDKQYRLYADTAGGNEFYTSADTTLEPVIDIEKGIYINQIVGSSSNALSINFKSPDPETNIKFVDGGLKQDNVSIELCIEGTSNCKQVYINKAGLITVQ